jgi:type II secretory pathway component PulK
MTMHKRRHGAKNNGFALFGVLVCLAVAAMLFAVFLRTVNAGRNRAERLGRASQSDWLAESAIERAVARMRVDPSYTGETWRVSAEQLGGSRAGVVAIVVRRRDEAPDRFDIEVVADFPDGTIHRKRTSKTIEAVINNRS